MAKVMDYPVQEPSSDNEEINKLFPRCRLRSTISDVNRNTIVKDQQYKLSSPFGSNSTVNSMDKANDNYLLREDIDDQVDEGPRRPPQPLSPTAPSDTSETSSRCSQQDGGSGGNSTTTTNQNNSLIAEDRSVISAYDYCDYDGSLLCNSKDGPSNSHSGCGDSQEYTQEIPYEPELDVAYQLESASGYCLRESRIEIAGGREIFSKSRSKPAKKRQGDDLSYHHRQRMYDHGGVHQKDEYKRYSADVMYDDKLRRYTYACTGSVDRLHACSKYRTESFIQEEDPSSPARELRMNGRASLKKSASVKGLQDFPMDAKQRPFSSGHLVYEAPVRNAEIVYDDIGELIDHHQQSGTTVNDIGDGVNAPLKASSPTSNRRVLPTSYRGEILESPNSDTEGAFQFIHNKPHIGSLDASSPVSPCSRSWNTDTNVLENSRNYSPEDMDTDSEPPSPYRDGIARVIGNVPIAEYEGSPRRYGPRPGFAQRVISDDDKREVKMHPTTCEELLKVIAGESHLRPFVPKSNEKSLSESPLKNDTSALCDGPLDENQSLDLLTDHNDVGSKEQKVCAQESDFSELEYRLYRVNTGSSYVGRRLAQQASSSGNTESPKRSDVKLVNGDVPHATTTMTTTTTTSEEEEETSPSKPPMNCAEDGDSSPATPAFLPNEHELMLLHESVHQHTLQVEMVEQDLESISTYPGTEDLGETEVGEQVDHTRNFTLSPETTDCDSNDVESVVSLEGSMNSAGRLMSSMPVLEDGLSSGHSSDRDEVDQEDSSEDEEDDACDDQPQLNNGGSKIDQDFCKAKPSNGISSIDKLNHHDVTEYMWRHSCNSVQRHELEAVDLSYFDALAPKQSEDVNQRHSGDFGDDSRKQDVSSVSEAIKEIKQAIQMSKNVQLKSTHSGKSDGPNQPVWVPRLSGGKPKDGCHGEPQGERNVDEEDCDTDQETDRLLGAQRTDDKGFYDEKGRNANNKKKSTSKEVLIHEPAVLIEGVLFRARYLGSTQLVCEGQPTKATRMMQAEEAVSRIKSLQNPARQFTSKTDVSTVRGSADEAYATGRGYDTDDQLKISLCPHAAPEGETQPSTEVDLFISTEKIMVLNTDLKEIMMDHALRAISYIADIGDLVVLMARRRVMNSPDDPSEPKIKRTPKMICHVFESEEAQFIAQSIGQAFQVAYMEFLKANGIEDSSFVKEMDYQEVLNSQEIFGNELEMFAKKEKQKEVVVPKQKGEILGMVIVESGWGSMLPTVVIANMAQSGPAARCGQLNIGDQIIAINGISLVGLPLSTCQNYIKNTKTQTVVKLTVVPCAPVVEVKIKRPDTKYQLGFSVQNGVICSLLRGGIAERGGVRVGHRIIEINGQSVVAVPHEKIVNLLATSVGEIHMKTMPTSMFRLLTGQESPLYI